MYDIWRSTESPNAGFSTIASDVATAYGVYLDTGLTNGTEYHYRVVPKDETTGALICDHSAPASATPAARRRR